MMERDELRSRMRVRRHVAGGGVYPKAGSLGTFGHAEMLRHVFVAMLLGMVFMLAPVQRAYANPIEDLGNAVAQFFGIGEETEPAAAFEEDAVSDPNTMTTWQDIVHKDTENIGRIWTDKTVSAGDIQLPAIDGSPTGAIDIAKGNSDFLVGFSALSSTSNTSVSSSKPLDIVLVLDVSTSMNEDMPASISYEPTYSVDKDSIFASYYGKNEDGTFSRIDRKTTTTGWIPHFSHWELNGKKVEPKTSASDADPNHIQFYTMSWQRVSRMDALKTAAKNFVDSTAKRNESIIDASKQHRVSIVTFSDDGRIRQNLTECTTESAGQIKSTIENLRAKGNTYPGNGMKAAIASFRNARSNAQKVVVFFTDGNPAPANSDSFTPSLANAGIEASGTLKEGGTLVYSIGVFEGADPSKTETSTQNQFNAYMHAMSSNYPKATAWNVLNDRSADSDFYKAATDADELNGIFEEISEEINKGTGLPTEVTNDGFANKDGYITFTDELGAYMQVDEFKQLVFADKIFEMDSKIVEGNVTTYKYVGTGGNDLYPNGNVSDIVVQVTTSDSLERGDVVTVKIPGSLIPLRSFTVDSTDDGTTMTIKEAYPLRIFFGVSVKPGVAEVIGSGTADRALLNYIAQNTKDGKTSFYSNLYTASKVVNGLHLGDTTASFVPAEGNSFYYFTENTPLYTDQECHHKLMTEPQSGLTYYYKRSYYELNKDGKTATQKDSITRFVGANFEATTTFWGEADDGSYYIKAGAPRLTRVEDLTLSKTDNTTSTASEVINPQWDNINNPNMVKVALGNNGKIDVELPGTLAIHKNAQVAADKNLSTDVLTDKSFEFEISIPSAKGKTLKAEVKNSQGDVTAKLFDITFNAEGRATHSIKDDETLYIYGLDANAEYTVAENANKLPAGFTQTSATGEKGTVAGNKVTIARFVNTYDVTSVTVEADAFAKWQKSFNRWDLAPSFDIRLAADQAGNPMPEGFNTDAEGHDFKIVEANKQANTGNFGAVQFNKPGVYDYTVSEVTPLPGNAIPGITYSDASYNVRVTVTDTGNGSLTADVKMTKTSDDGGQVIEPATPVENKTAGFTNSFSATSVDRGPLATKNYVNNGGEESKLENGKFSFKIKLVDGNAQDAPLPAGAKPDSQGYIYVVNQGTSVAFGQATFTDKHVGNEYTYELSEVIPVGATADNNYTFNGMTYDPTVYHAKFTVTSEAVEGNATVKVAVSYSKVTEAGEEPLPAETIPVFTNSYDPTDAVLEGDTAVKVKKTLNGRDSLENEKFDFTMGPADTATRTALLSGNIVLDGSEDNFELSTSISGLKKGVATTANMGKVTFKKPGTYVFNVIENAPADGKGMIYDTHTARVTVVVADNNGVLKAKVTYNNGQGADTDAAAFVNAYTASHTYGTGMHINVGKILNGRDQKAGEFEFAIKGIGLQGSEPAQDAEAKLAATDKKFATIAPARDGVESLVFDKLGGIKFTQADAGKTFSYELSEIIPTSSPLGGVTYDRSQYRINIQVIDNGNGTLHTVTTITRSVDGSSWESVATADSSDGADTTSLGFINTYKAASVDVDPADHGIHLTKILTGRDWTDADSFTFKLVGVGNPQPTETSKVVSKPEAKDGEEVTFDFGKAKFDAPGLYHYQVSEAVPEDGSKIAGMTYDEHVADIYVSVTDSGDGQLVAKTKAYNTAFTNKYEAKLNHNDAGGLVVTKTTHGHAMTQGQFQFQVEALKGEGISATETAKRIGIKDGITGEFGNVAGEADEKKEMTSPNPIEFTQADAGKVFKFKVSERGADGKFGTGGTKDGYTYDGQIYTVELSIADNGDGTLKLTTRVEDKAGKETEQTSPGPDGQKVPTYLDFVNTYFNKDEAKDVTAQNIPETSIDGRLVGVGDQITYTIDWANNAVDENGVPCVATVKVADMIPTGTELVSGTVTNDGKFENDTITWTFENQKPGASGTVSFTVEVTEDAVKVDSIKNSAELTIGSNNPVSTNETENFIPEKSVEDKTPDTGVQVGDTLTYTIEYKNTEDKAAQIVVTDALPKGLTVIESSISEFGMYDAETRTITWTINNVPAGRTGKVSFDAVVNEQALIAGEEGSTANTAQVQVGNKPSVSTNTTPDHELNTGSASVRKTVEVPEGALINTEQEFSFTVELLDAVNNPLSGSYIYETVDAAGQKVADGVIANGEGSNTITLKHLQTATITGLPEGAKVKATETEVTGYTADEVIKTSDVVETGKTAAVDFVNTYSTGDGVTITGENSIRAQKDLQGRAWATGDSFVAQLEAVGGKAEAGNDIAKDHVPMPAGAKDGLSMVEMTSDAPVSFGDIAYKVPGTYIYKVTEKNGDAGGITYSTAVYEVTVIVTDNNNGTLSADVAYKLEGAADNAEAPTIATFVNTYEAIVPGGTPVTTDNQFTKILTGRDWKQSDSFTFVIEPNGDAPAPEKRKVTLTGLTSKKGEGVKFGFGKINFTFGHIEGVTPADDGTRTKDFTYAVKEVIPADADKITGITYDGRPVTLTVTLKDDGRGNLTATYKVANGPFTNTYESGEVSVDEVDVNGGVRIVKTMTGRAIAENDFEFTMTATNENAKDKFGGVESKKVATKGALLGTGADANTAVETIKVPTGLTFGLEDAGKTFDFDVSETKGGDETKGYTNDRTNHMLKFVVTDNGVGELKVVANLDNNDVATWTNTVATRAASDVVSIPFENSYNTGSITVGGKDGVELKGIKILTGRPMDAGEFHFNVINAADAEKKVIATGTNDAQGAITFNGVITYTIEKLNKDVADKLATVNRDGNVDVYTYTYTVSEEALQPDSGVTPVQDTQTIAVNVTDDGEGDLSAEVVYPDGQDKMMFENAYGEGETAEIAVNGTKVLKVADGCGHPDIVGDYTFTITGVDENGNPAPMPEKTKASNGQGGGVSFGKIKYTMENVFGGGAATADAEGLIDAEGLVDNPASTPVTRTKTFAYTVTESGSVPGVANDAAATTGKTFTVEVTDNGDGTLSAVKSGESADTDFTFTNTYDVKPQDSSLTGDGGFTITKKLTGRDLNEGEFEFKLISQDEGKPVVLTATNDASGNVEFPSISFAHPGTYKYVLVEVDGDLGGVTYDTKTYEAVASAVDNGDGTMTVAWTVNDGGKPLDGTDVTFVNTYAAAGTSIQFNAAKVLSGRELKEGEFSFKLLDGDGNVLQTVKNGAPNENGSAPVTFDAVKYDESGEFDYQIVEVQGDAEGVTYDKTVFTYHVAVKDNGKGNLEVSYTEGETGAPVFRNTYKKPAGSMDPDPVDPAPIDPKPIDPKPEDSKPNDGLPGTGDGMIAAVAVTAGTGLISMAVGAHLNKRKKHHG